LEYDRISLLSVLVGLLFGLIDRTVSINDNSNLQLSIHPNSGYSTESIEIRCHIIEPSVYDNIYLFVKTDNVKPSGILLMADTTVSECRINENKRKYIQVNFCNASLILINVNHEIINDSLHTIEYACSQGEGNALSSFRILSKKSMDYSTKVNIIYLEEQTARYYDQKSSNSSSILTHTLLLLLFVLTTITEVR
jgi:hypothetical protein